MFRVNKGFITHYVKRCPTFKGCNCLDVSFITSRTRTRSRWIATAGATNPTEELKTEYDAIVIGAGHNGLVAASYLQKAGVNTCVLERRHVIGGAACTEEIIPGYKFSRASYVLSLLRPQISKDLELKKHGLKVYLRNPNSYTPLLEDPDPKTGRPRSLILGRDAEENKRQISQFSQKDAEMFEKYEHQLNKIAGAMEPLLDNLPLSIPHLASGKLRDALKELPALRALVTSLGKMGVDAAAFYELITAPTTKVLNKWFESEPLKATLATDSVIGAMLSPNTPGSGYVLLHHVMGEIDGIKGAWGYVEGGMGGLSAAIAKSARSHGANIFTDQPVSEIIVDSDGNARGVALKDGTEIKSKMILSNATPKVTFLDLVNKSDLPSDFLNEIHHIDYTSPVTKINVAVNKIPNFTANPNDNDNQPMPHHRGTIHLNCENSEMIVDAYQDAEAGSFSKKPVIEMTIPSSLDPTLAPPGCHVCLLFTQYTPYYLDGNREWTDKDRNDYADLVFDCIEQYAPGFKESVVGRDILTPTDLEKTFGLTGGNIFHAAMSLDQLYLGRPVPSFSNTRSPVKGLYLCGSGAHPGGGVMGSPGRLAAITAMRDNSITPK